MWNLRLSMILYGAIQMAEGIVMFLWPDRVASLLNFSFVNVSALSTDFISYIFALTGAALIAGGFLFIVSSVNPLKNINAIRFAVLWTGLALFGQIYAITKGYVTFGDIWSNLIVTAIFLFAFLLFCPWPWHRKSYK